MGKDIYCKLIMLRTRSGFYCTKNSQIYRNVRVYVGVKYTHGQTKCLLISRVKNSNISLLMTCCQTDIGSRSGKLQIVQGVATVKHIMKILLVCFGHTKQFWMDFTDFCSRNIRAITLTLYDVLYGVEDITICNLIFTAKTFDYNKRIHEVCCALYYAITR